ncbi:AP2-like ethylene-responsive transcription factor BBM1 isoform X2 [Malus sylvestris]|uniref:AP2-like ethylene-responsive transcription factor BBM1 isoform X2 n=1 Tax=Malus sylvestris TaxID=3752 RepID=UPI0021AD4C18|nr:AP2-like ethylene-responsive transcription factor BBM1 isoform X2 [Malus sylvestris]
MGSMNWLGFSLSPQEVVPADPTISEGTDHRHQQHGQDHQDLSDQTLVSRLRSKYSDEISGTDASGDCFDLTNSHDDSSATPTAPNHHSLNHLPTSFGMLHQAAFDSQGADWNMNSPDSTNYKFTSDHLSMLNSCNTLNLENHQNRHQQQPKLENFLGRHSFIADHPDHIQSSTSSAHAYNSKNTASINTTDNIFSRTVSSLQLPLEISDPTNVINGDGAVGTININSSSSNIGLSMIKTWLRNQPASQLQEMNKNDVNGIGVSNTSTSTSSAQTLSLSMSTAGATTAGDQTCSSDRDRDSNKQAIIRTAAPAATIQSGIDNQTSIATAIEAVPRKSIDTFGQRTSIYRGVTRHRWTGRYEAHLWDNSCRREGQTRKGRQVYLGGYDKEEKAARAYDLAALKYWGTTTTTNFPISNYEKEVDEMKHMTRQEYVASLRRKSSGFSRGASIYRGVTRHHQHGRWQARIGRVAGNKDLYLGTFSTQEEAAEAYDIAAIKFRGLNAVTNFDMTRYDVKSILESSTLPIGGAAKRLKDVEQAHHQHLHEMTLLADGHNRSTMDDQREKLMMMNTSSNSLDQYHQQLINGDHHGMRINNVYGTGAGWPTLAFNQAATAVAHQAAVPPFGMHYYSSVPYNSNGGQRVWCKQEQDTNSQSFYQPQDHHRQDLHHHQLLQLGSTHNFFQPVNLMGNSTTDSMEHSSGSNSVIYNGTTAGDHGGYIIPMGTAIANDHENNSNAFGNGSSDHDQVKPALGYENAFGSSSTTTTVDAYNHAKSLYYLPVQAPQSSSVSSIGVSTKGSSEYDNWVPTAVPTSTHNMAPFTVWNDT